MPPPLKQLREHLPSFSAAFICLPDCCASFPRQNKYAQRSLRCPQVIALPPCHVSLILKTSSMLQSALVPMSTCLQDPIVSFAVFKVSLSASPLQCRFAALFIASSAEKRRLALQCQISPPSPNFIHNFFARPQDHFPVVPSLWCGIKCVLPFRVACEFDWSLIPLMQQILLTSSTNKHFVAETSKSLLIAICTCSPELNTLLCCDAVNEANYPRQAWQLFIGYCMQPEEDLEEYW